MSAIEKGIAVGDIFEQSLEKSEEESHAGVWGAPGRGTASAKARR